MGKTEADSSLELDESDATDEELHEAANLAEMFQIQADDSDFMAEFKSHNLQNRMHFQLQSEVSLFARDRCPLFPLTSDVMQFDSIAHSIFVVIFVPF